MYEMQCVEDEKTPVLLHAKSFAFGHHELGTRLVYQLNFYQRTVPTPIEFSALLCALLDLSCVGCNSRKNSSLVTGSRGPGV